MARPHCWSKATAAPGVVRQWVASAGSHGRGTAYVVELNFQTAQGQSHIWRFHWGTGITSLLPAVGSPVEVLYDPADSGRVALNSFYGLWFLPSLLALFSAILAALWRFAGKKASLASPPAK